MKNIFCFTAATYARVIRDDVKADDPFADIQSDWGYVTVRQHAHMFWWLFYQDDNYSTQVMDKPDEIPVIVWLQVGFWCLLVWTNAYVKVPDSVNGF